VQGQRERGLLTRLRGHVGNNLVGYLALFVALSGSAYAAKPLITGAEIQDNSIQSVDVEDGTLESVDIAAAIARDSEILPTVLASDGSGSTLDADLLDGLDSSAFLAAGSKAADSNLLDGLDSSAFLAAAGKAADSAKLDGLDSTQFAKKSIAGAVFAGAPALGSGFTVQTIGPAVYKVTFPAGTFGTQPVAVVSSLSEGTFMTVHPQFTEEAFIVKGWGQRRRSRRPTVLLHRDEP
jgi:hypothetical protein